MGMERERLKVAWARRYTACPADEVVRMMTQQASVLEGRMRKLACFPDKNVHGIPKAGLVTALGMSLGVQRQLFGGLTSAPSGGILKGGGGVEKENRGAVSPTFSGQRRLL